MEDDNLWYLGKYLDKALKWRPGSLIVDTGEDWAEGGSNIAEDIGSGLGSLGMGFQTATGTQGVGKGLVYGVLAIAGVVVLATVIVGVVIVTMLVKKK